MSTPRNELWSAALALVALTVALPARGQEIPPEQLRELMQRHVEASEPGPEHERLAGLAGPWHAQITIWPEPGAELMLAEAAVESTMILGGRFLLQHATIEGGPFAGESYTLLGFDRRSAEYTWLTLDTTGTYWVTARGAAAPGARRVVLSGVDHDAIFDGDQIYDIVLEWMADGAFRTEIIFKDPIHTRGGDPFKMVETLSRRPADTGDER